MNPSGELAGLLDRGAVSTDEDDLSAHARDWSSLALIEERRGTPVELPACVVRPGGEEEVAAVLAWANASRTPVVPFGGGSGVCGGIEAGGMVVIDLSRMNAILDLDERSRTVRVQAGINGRDLQDALEKHGLMLGHQPQSIDISTVGGWVATRACGQLSAGYGGIEDALVGADAVFPAVAPLPAQNHPRASVGPEVTSLLTGSEGTLGTITSATLRVHPVPTERAGVALRFAHMADGVAACRKLAQSTLHPTVVRLYDRDDAALFLLNHPDEEAAPLLILAFDGEQAGHRSERAAQLTGGERASGELVEHWWEHRNDAVQEFRRLMAGEGLLGPHALVDTMEVAGTWTDLRDLYHSMKDALARVADICACHVSHVYPDGACLYYTLAAAPGSDEEAMGLHARWWETGMQACIAAGGAISHHHGIGRLKVPWLTQGSDGRHGLLRAIKRTVDPNRIMNPGVLGL